MGAFVGQFSDLTSALIGTSAVVIAIGITGSNKYISNSIIGSDIDSDSDVQVIVE